MQIKQLIDVTNVELAQILVSSLKAKIAAKGVRGGDPLKVVYDPKYYTLRVISTERLLFVDRGRQPANISGGKMPPLQVMKRYVEDYKNEKDLARQAYLIARSVHKKGVVGKMFKSEARADFIDKAQKILSENYAGIMKKLFEDGVKETTTI
jgi:hypothetical protein